MALLDTWADPTGSTDSTGVPIGRRIRRHPLRLTLLADVVALALAVAATRMLDTAPPAGTVVLVAALWVALMFSARAYEPMPTGFSELRGRRTLRAGVGLGLACWVLTAVEPLLATPGELLVLTGAVTGAALTHRAAVGVLRAALHAPARPTGVLVAGEPDDVQRVLVELRRAGTALWEVAGVCLTQEPHEHFESFGTPVHIGVDDLLTEASGCGAEAVIVVPCRRLDPAALRRLSWQLERTGVHLFLGTGLLDVGGSRATLVRGGDLGMLHVRPVSSSGPARLAKNLAERSAALLGLVLIAPVLLAVAVAVRVDSPGSALFRQTRVGEGGRTFTMLKFRSMTDGADRAVTDLEAANESDGVLFKIKADPRVTRVGRVIRRYSLDELPQLWNVVRGDMALVGPRPALPAEVAQYDHDARRRLAARPGITGLWQVSGRSDLSWEDTVRLDLHYVDNWSFVLDLGIALRTVGTVLGHRGAY